VETDKYLRIFRFDFKGGFLDTAVILCSLYRAWEESRAY